MVSKSDLFVLFVFFIHLFRSCHLQLELEEIDEDEEMTSQVSRLIKRDEDSKGSNDANTNGDGNHEDGEDITFQGSLRNLDERDEESKNSNDTNVGDKDAADIYKKYCTKDGKNNCYGHGGGGEKGESCVERGNCEFLIGYKRMGTNTAWFDMMLMGPSSRFISLGLSKDKSVGDDLFVECLTRGENNTIYMSFFKNEKTRVKLPVKCQDIRTSRLADCEVESFKLKGKPYIRCSFKWKSVTVVDLKRFDMNKIAYYLHLGYGKDKDLPQLQNETEFKYEKGKNFITTDGTIHFNKTAVNAPVMWIKLHGIFSMLVFLIFIPNATFCARYLKETKTKKLIMGRRMWYFIHILLMIVGYLFFVLSMIFILVYTYKNGLRWPSTDEGKIHAVIGAVAGVLFTTLIAFSWLRPASSDNKRIVGILHFITGMATLILGLQNIMMSYALLEAKMSCLIKFMVPVWIVWTVFWVLIMGFHFLWLGRLINVSTTRGFIPLPLQAVVTFDTPGGKQRVNIFLYYVTGTIVLTLIMIIIYGASKSSCVAGAGKGKK